MPLGLGRRFLVEAAFLVAVAVAAALLSLTTPAIIAVMGGAWLAVALLEWGLSRRAPAREPEVEAVAPSPSRAEPVRRVEQPLPEPSLEPEPLAEPIPPEPIAEIDAAEPAEVVAEAPPLPEPLPPAREPIEVRPELVAVPEPEPEPRPEPEPEPEPAQAAVVQLDPRWHEPREWNLWDLERAARGAAGADAERDEERAFLLVYLREFAGPDGSLPVNFDGLVREAFGDVLQSVSR